MIIEIDPNPSTDVLNFLREVASNERTSDLRRISALVALTRTEGPGPLRALRDNKYVQHATRYRAATELLRYTVEDRATSARVLHQIATDTTARPALRWRAAQDLAEFGAPGRNEAVAALQSITADDTLTATARAEATRLLATIRPSTFSETLTILQGLTDTDNPLHRRQILLALGSLDVTKALPPLRAMVHNCTLRQSRGYAASRRSPSCAATNRRQHQSWHAS